MTKAHALKEYYKKVYNLELEGMTTVQVLKDIFKKKYEMNVEGNSFVSVLMNAMSEDDSDLVIRTVIYDGNLVPESIPDSSMYVCDLQDVIGFTDKIFVTIDDVEYEMTKKIMNESIYYYGDFVNGEPDFVAYPFFIIVNDGTAVMDIPENKTHHVKIEATSKTAVVGNAVVGNAIVGQR